MQPTTATLIVAGLGIGGTLGGIVVGHFLTKSSQQKQWLLNNRKDEFRELLTAMAESMTAAMKVDPRVRRITTEEQDAIVQTQANFFRVVRDRIYIADDVGKLEVEIKWLRAHGEYDRTHNLGPLR